MNRRDFLAAAGGAYLSSLSCQAQEAGKADFTVRIGAVNLEIAPRRVFKTIGYNGSVPGPLLRMTEGQPVTIDVLNETSTPELVHWHGLFIPSEVDGSAEEGTPRETTPARCCPRRPCRAAVRNRICGRPSVLLRANAPRARRRAIAIRSW